MRISTGMIYDAGLASMQTRTATLLRTQQQLSEGRRILKPSDDPVAAARALEVGQSQAVNAGQATTRDNVKSALGISDSQLDSAGDLMVRIRELAVQGGNAALSSADRRSVANELRALFDEMVGIANSRDGTGQYLFGGYQTSNQPFAGSVDSGVVYSGDDGARTLRVSGSRELAISDSGNDVFMRIKNGNGVFATGMQNDKSANAAHITYEGATLTNPSATTGSFEMRFWTDTAGTAQTQAQAVGTVDINGLAYPLTFTDGAESQIVMTIDGAPINVDLDPAGTGTAYADAASLIAAMQAAVGVAATVSLSTTGRLVVTSASSGAPGSTLVFADVGAGASSVNALFGAGGPVIANGANGAAGTTYVDLVNASTGLSLYTNTASTAGGAGNTFTHAFQSGTPFNLSSVGPNAFDYGALAVVTGTPADGDTFTVTRAATTLTMTGKTFNADAARATISAGSVSNPDLWRQSANSGKLEVRFWNDAQGTIATSGQAVGSRSIPPGLAIGAGNNEFNININGGGAVAVTVPSATYTTPADLKNAVQLGVNAALGAAPPAAGSATVSLDSANRMVVTLTDTGAASNLALTAVGGDTGFADLFGGAVTSTAGLAASPGRTFYDLVDATTGTSLFTGGASTAGGAGNSYTHAYTSGSSISLAGSGGPGQQAFDYGASVTVSGIPAGGDAFTIDSDDAYYGNGYFVTAAKTATTLNSGSGAIGVGEVLDNSKWNHPANSRNLEVRFWEDTAVQPTKLYYDLVDAETEKSLFTDSASTAGGAGNTFTRQFVAGNGISFSGLNVAHAGPPAATVTDFGIKVTVQGTPASGDAFKVQASESQSVFETMSRLITTLETGAPAGTAGNTYLANEVAGVLNSVGQVEDNFLRVRASIGSRLAEVDDLDTVGQNLDLQYSETLSRLQDLDYADAITRLTRQQMELQAAQQSFSRVSQLSLFQYL